jgi:CRP/FNR family cyclic AMP-dependent transcriptional regulator
MPLSGSAALLHDRLSAFTGVDLAMTEILWRFKDHPLTRFAPGATLITEGQQTGRLFVLASGAVSVLRKGTPVVRFDEPGTVLGEIATLLRAPHTATVRAEGEVSAYVIDNALEWLEDRPAMALHVGALLAERLQRTTTMLVELQQAGAPEPQRGLIETLFRTLTGQRTTRRVAQD